jgi:hypothetical protein
MSRADGKKARVRMLLLIGILIFFVMEAVGTTILAVRTPEMAVIVADSKPIMRGTPGPSTVCKIFPIHSGFLAIAGLEHDSGRGFYSKELVDNAFASAGTFSARVSAAERIVTEKARTEMLRLKAEDPKTYAFTIKNRGNFLDLLFVAVEEKTPLLSARRFHYNDSTGTVEVGQSLDCPGKDCPGGTYFAFFGEAGEVQRAIGERPRQALNVQVLRNLLQKQIEATPDKVGPPITVLQVEPGGARWISNEVGCPAL